MRFLATNLCTETATTIAASSANVNFPVSNLKNPLRSKRYRSSGTFVVDSIDNKINFKEVDGGTELTATISAGSYSVSGLQAAIKVALELVGDNAYTVSFSSTTGLWSIASDGEYFDLLNASGTDALTSLLVKALGFTALDKTGATTYAGSLIAIHTKESVRFDFQTTQDIDSVVLFWPKEDGIRLSDNAVVKIEANATDVWTSPAVSETLTIDNTYMVASHFFDAPQSYRYWRVTVQDPQNPYLHIELGLIWIGENTEFNEPENGFKFSLEDMSVVSRTAFGHDYVDEYPQIATLEFKYNYLQYPTIQALENAFRLNGSKRPVLVVFDEAELVFNKNHFLIYGKMEKVFNIEHVIYKLFNGSLKITELG